MFWHGGTRDLVGEQGRLKIWPKEECEKNLSLFFGVEGGRWVGILEVVSPSISKGEAGAMGEESTSDVHVGGIGTWMKGGAIVGIVCKS